MKQGTPLCWGWLAYSDAVREWEKRMTEATLNETPIGAWHQANGGRIVPFAGWSMPVQYSSIADEHQATRTGIGLFDISHMGRLQFEGPGAIDFLDHVLTRRASSLKPDQIRYSLVTDTEGGILDDVLVYALATADEKISYRLVVNASNRLKLLEWFGQHQNAFDVDVVDETCDTGMIAIQGPGALAIAQQVLDETTPDATRLDQLKYYSGVLTGSDDGPDVVSRTGYTGEDGCEWVLPFDKAESIWQRLIDSGATPVGLGARDTLRLEAAMPLYGHELDETVNPFEAGLGFAVQFKDHAFIGSDVLQKVAADPPRRVRVGLRAEGKRVPRQHCEVQSEGRNVGKITSGTYSPTFEQPISMAYVRPDVAELGTELQIDVRGRTVQAVVVELPFYKRSAT